jgi:hypothetical protein
VPWSEYLGLPDNSGGDFESGSGGKVSRPFLFFVTDLVEASLKTRCAESNSVQAFCVGTDSPRFYYITL